MSSMLGTLREGEPLREIELHNGRHAVLRGLDSETWRTLRDIFLSHKLIALNDRGHYLLSRDLNGIRFWQLKEWVNQEQPLEQQEISTDLSWQREAYRLLREQRAGQRETLGPSLVELFSR